MGKYHFWSRRYGKMLKILNAEIWENIAEIWENIAET
jgi:hypothetical protein